MQTLADGAPRPPLPPPHTRVLEAPAASAGLSAWRRRDLCSGPWPIEGGRDTRRPAVRFGILAADVLSPALALLAYYYVFIILLGVSGHAPAHTPALAWLVVGYMAWMIVSDTPMQLQRMGPRVLVFPRRELQRLKQRVFVACALIVGVSAWNQTLGWSGLWVPLYCLASLALGLGAGCVVINVLLRLRGSQTLINSVFRAWFYVTPVVYPLKMVPEQYHPLAYLNPMTCLVEGMRRAALFGHMPPPVMLLYPVLVGLVLGSIGLWTLPSPPPPRMAMAFQADGGIALEGASHDLEQR